jgi:hypothetical protein
VPQPATLRPRDLSELYQSWTALTVLRAGCLEEEISPLITASSLKAYTAKDLAQMAKRRGVSGWHSMRKEELVKALLHVEKGNGKSAPTNGEAGRNGHSAKNGSGKKPVGNRRLQREHRKKEQQKDISCTPKPQNGNSVEPSDRVVLMVRDAFWLHVYWEISSRAIIRARAAMAEQWHTAKPVIRLLKSTSSNSTSAAESVEKDIRIHGGVNNWYIDVNDPPKTFRVEIGYLASSGKFHGLARSNSVTTPKTSSSDLADHNWTDLASNCDKILAQSGAYSTEGNDGELQRLFEERLRRPMGSPMMTRYGVGAESVLEREDHFSFEVEAEMIVFGSTQPDAHVVLGGEPVKVRPDGTFTVRMSMSDGRQVLPVVSSSGDGRKQQTIILAVERNTKTMEPVAREA